MRERPVNPLRGALVAVSLVAGVVASAGEARAMNWSIGFEGGLADYTADLGSRLETGGRWGVRATARLLPALSLGAGYAGAANRLNTGNPDLAPLLVRDSVSAVAQLSPGKKMLEPFLELGIGGGRASVRRGSTPEALPLGWSLEVPVSAGLLWRAGLIEAGLRFGYGVILGQASDQLSGSLTLGAGF